jgi:hypothetical protein
MAAASFLLAACIFSLRQDLIDPRMPTPAATAVAS